MVMNFPSHISSPACETRMEMNELLIEFLPRHNTVPLTLSPAQRCDPFSEAGTKNTELNIRLASQFPTLLRYPNFNIKPLLLWDEASKYKWKRVELVQISLNLDTDRYSSAWLGCCWLKHISPPHSISSAQPWSDLPPAGQNGTWLSEEFKC